MESADNETSGGIPFNQYRLSWVAYVRAVVVFFFLSALAAALGALNQSLSVVAVLAALAIFAYQVLYLRSMIPMCTEVGKAGKQATTNAGTGSASCNALLKAAGKCQ